MSMNEIERLYSLGFGIHWLKPKSKAPVLSKWTTGPRHTLVDLKRQYRPGYNVGVRLGRVSKIDEHYLAVIDCDVKSTEPEHLLEMQSKLKELFPELDLKSAPRVKSGRGNGSSHIYVVTKEPAKPKRLAQSQIKVYVRMPSAKPSQAELATIPKDKLAQGYRLRAAWEISLMGEGQQVVLPPSIHPDSGKQYKWARLLERAADIPFVGGNIEVATTPKASATEATFKAASIDLRERGVPQGIISAIEDGENADADRSVALFTISMALVRFGLSNQEVLTVLTEKDTYLGAAAFEHAETTDRARAAAWLEKYTLAKARREAGAEEIFKANAVVTSTLPPEENEATHQAEEQNGEWLGKLELTGSGPNQKPKITLKNALLVLEKAPAEPVFSFDAFANRILYHKNPPWAPKAQGEEVGDIGILQIKRWLAKHYRLEPSVNTLWEATQLLAHDRAFHPVRDYLSSLTWDGKPRLATWLKDYLKAVGPERYLAAVGSKFLIAMVKRAFQPGCKFDHMMILEGKQGLNKTRSMEALGGKWYSNSSLETRDKDGVLYLQGKWLTETSELNGWNNADNNALKAFVARQTDRIRAPFDRAPKDYPRQGIFVGTTNDEHFLTDETGNRRYWPVYISGACDVEALYRDRDQLFAEAMFCYQMGDDKLYIDDKEVEAEAVGVQESKIAPDSLEEVVLGFLEQENPNFPVHGFTLAQIMGEFGPLQKYTHIKMDTRGEKRVARILRRLGYEKSNMRKDGIQGKVWVRKI